MIHASNNELAGDLASLLNEVVQGWAPVSTDSDRGTGAVAGLIQNGDCLEAWLTFVDPSRRIDLACSPGRPTSPDEVRLMKRIVSVFKADLDVVGDVKRAQDLWGTLSATRFIRAAARLSPFSTLPLLRWLNAFQAAARQTYEGDPFAGNLVLVKHLPSFRADAGERFEAFSRPLGFEQALLREKWLKPFLQDGTFALVTVGHSGAARGFVDVTVPSQERDTWAPTDDLKGLYTLLKPGRLILSASPFGDIHLAFPTGVTFVNAQGKWRYQDWDVLRQILTRRLAVGVADAALRLVAGASYRRSGSLYVFLNEGADPSSVVPDHASAKRNAHTLRSTVAGGRITEPTTRRVLTAASRIDGAILMSSRGQVIDVASMISEPEPGSLASIGLTELQRFPGARSTAAWNASIHGLAIKVSDDGPIDVYDAGKHVFHAG